MALHNDFGSLGEELACQYLTENEYRLLERNWRKGHLEVDIIADHYGEIVFVEVKARQHETDLNTALGAVDLKKKTNIIEAAEAYLLYNGIDAPCRFDVITVVGQEPPYEVRHYRDVYSSQSVARKKRYY